MLTFFKNLLKKDPNHIYQQSIRSELKGLAPFYKKQIPHLERKLSIFPVLTNLMPFGLNAYHFNIMVKKGALQKIENLINEKGFQQQTISDGFKSLHNHEGETVSILGKIEFGFDTFIFITNSPTLLEAVFNLDLSPPAPWVVFPDEDPDTLGSLQGTLEFWWATYWKPYWNSLDDIAKSRYLDESDCPSSWRELIDFQDN